MAHVGITDSLLERADGLALVDGNLDIFLVGVGIVEVELDRVLLRFEPLLQQTQSVRLRPRHTKKGEPLSFLPTLPLGLLKS
jgi:hypothetical protein